MAKVMECGDGFLVRRATDHDLVATAEAHLRDAHAELVGTISLAMAKEVSP